MPRYAFLIAAGFVSICNIQSGLCDTLLFVDDSASSGGDGKSWIAPFNDLQHAIDAANSATELPVIIRVGQGSYRPSFLTDGADPKSATFRLPADITIKGGYAGFGAVDPDLNDPAGFETILTGDLNGDDLDADFPNGPSRSDNASTVLTADIGPTFTLEGIVVTGADGGSGVLVEFTVPDRALYIRQCRFERNSGSYGGAIRSTHSSWAVGGHIRDCLFLDNSAEMGGAIGADSILLDIENCRFLGNWASGSGGAIFSYQFFFSSVSNCLFSGNHADNYGGAIAALNQYSPRFVNCTIVGNSAVRLGGGFHGGSTSFSNPRFQNSILWGNSADNPAIVDRNLSILNDFAGAYCLPNVQINHCCIEGFDAAMMACPAQGNIDADPQVLDADGPDEVVGTEDDDLRLAAKSPCNDAGNNNDVVNSHGTTPIPDFDLDGNVRRQDLPNVPDVGEGTAPIVDMGAYESVAPSLVSGDMNCDGVTDLSDLSLFCLALTDADAYAAAQPGCCTCNVDVNDDGLNNSSDIAAFVTLISGG
ncbi:MAG: hypothetical protein H6818_05925 [Phycisphaerales bacterium]|nr:hypothetical protein [Phycisphaerales bacterium]MCB9862801.1 hypothetical protein [Phycisphaerales bacterium]